MVNDNNYDLDSIARMCEVAVILTPYNIEVEDLHDFFHNHVKVIFDEWENNAETEDFFKDEEELGYITAYANRVAKERYAKK